jgi:hypothetical protein
MKKSIMFLLMIPVCLIASSTRAIQSANYVDTKAIYLSFVHFLFSISEVEAMLALGGSFLVLAWILHRRSTRTQRNS